MTFDNMSRQETFVSGFPVLTFITYFEVFEKWLQIAKQSD